MIVPMYMSEVSTAGIRGSLVVLQQREFHRKYQRNNPP